MATWPEYAEQAGAALADWLTAHPWTPPADPGPDPGKPTPTRVVRINCGGPTVTVGGITWEADRAFTGGSTSSQGAGHYGADTVMETERWGNFSYSLSGLPPGGVVVRLHLAESYAAGTAPNTRLFNVTVRGATSMTVGGIDPFGLGGGQYEAAVKEIPASIGLDGFLKVAVQTVTNAGCLQGLEVLAYGTGTPTPNPGPGAGGGGTGVTATWLSGGNPNNNDPAEAVRFGSWRGRPVTAALCYPTRTFGWGPLVSATSGQPGIWKDKSITLIVQMPFFPQGGGNSYAAAARGDYVGQWQQLGRAWAAREAAGFARPVFSPGWEANHNGMHYWGGPGGGGQHYQSYGEYIDTYRLFAATVRGEYAGARFGWVPNGHGSPGFGAGKFPADDPFNIFPGDDVVDWIGVDAYDHYPPTTGGTLGRNKVEFDVESRRANGVRRYLAEAQKRGKGFLVAEWACDSNNPSGGNGGGDNPSFVTNMVAVFKEALASGVDVIECYYDDDAQRMSILGNTATPANPRAAAEYQRLYRSA